MRRTAERFRSLRIGYAFLVLALLLLGGSVAWAGQQTQEATVFGQVTDESGAVLPGVTVTVSGPALLVKQMVEVTDARGEYRVTPLPLGIYTVEFTLSGFQAQRREGVRLTAGFVAKIDVQMKVGSVEETITVSGQSPVVDVKTTSAGTQVTRDLLDSVPTSRNGFGSLLTLAAGAKPSLDFGQVSAVDPQFRAFGRPQNAWIVVEGVSTTSQFWGQSGYSNSFSFESIEEGQVTTLGSNAEAPTSGVQLNVIMKSGGNDFHGSGLVGQFADWMQSNNIDDNLRAQNLTTPLSELIRWDRGGDMGGRIARDKTWFYGAYRMRRDRATNPGAFFPDPSDSPANSYGHGAAGWSQTDKDYAVGKVTEQLTPTQKLIGSYQYEFRHGQGSVGDRFTVPDTQTDSTLNGHLGKGEYQLARGNKFLSIVGGRWVSTGPPQKSLSTVPAWKDSSGFLYLGQYTSGGLAALNRAGQSTDLRRSEARATMNWYKPNLWHGNHDFKMGGNYYIASADFTTVDRGAAGNYVLTFKSGAASQVQVGNNPVTPSTRLDYFGSFFQDSWAVNRRLSLNLGIRYANDKGWLPAQCRVAAPAPFQDLYPAQCYDEYHSKTWNPIAPRVHAAFDVTGDGKTVLKGGYGRFYSLHTQDELNLANNNANSVTNFKWKDLNSNRAWDVGESNLSLSGSDFISQARAVNSNLGGLVDNPNLLHPGSNEYSVSLEREIMNNLGARVTGIYSKDFNALRVVNTLRPFDSYNIPITSPIPLPDGSTPAGNPLGTITYYDFPASLAGAAFQRLMFINNDASDSTYKSFEVAVDKRLANHWQLLASYSTTWVNIPVIFETGGSNGSGDQRGTFSASFNPNAEINAHQQNREWVFRLGGSYQFPYDVLISANFSDQNGEPWARTAQFTTPQQGNITLRVEPVGAQLLPNQPLVTFRAEKGIRFHSGQRLSVAYSVINLLNANYAVSNNAFPYNAGVQTATGSTFGQTTLTANPRIGEVLVKYSF